MESSAKDGRYSSSFTNRPVSSRAIGADISSWMTTDETRCSGDRVSVATVCSGTNTSTSEGIEHHSFSKFVIPRRKTLDVGEIDQAVEVNGLPAQQQGPLKGVVAYVEVYSNRENRSQCIAKKLQDLGAMVTSRITNKVTHIIFKDGRQATIERATMRRIPVVSVLWIESCAKAKAKVPVASYLVTSVESDTPMILGRVRRLRSMQPKQVELGLSADKIIQRNRKRFLEAQQRAESLRQLNDPFMKSPTLSRHPLCEDVRRSPMSDQSNDMNDLRERINRIRDSSPDIPFDDNSPTTATPLREVLAKRLFGVRDKSSMVLVPETTSLRLDFDVVPPANEVILESPEVDVPADLAPNLGPVLVPDTLDLDVEEIICPIKVIPETVGISDLLDEPELVSVSKGDDSTADSFAQASLENRGSSGSSEFSSVDMSLAVEISPSVDSPSSRISHQNSGNLSEYSTETDLETMIEAVRKVVKNMAPNSRKKLLALTEIGLQNEFDEEEQEERIIENSSQIIRNNGSNLIKRSGKRRLLPQGSRVENLDLNGQVDAEQPHIEEVSREGLFETQDNGGNRRKVGKTPSKTTISSPKSARKTPKNPRKRQLLNLTRNGDQISALLSPQKANPTENLSLESGTSSVRNEFMKLKPGKKKKQLRSSLFAVDDSFEFFVPDQRSESEPSMIIAPATLPRANRRRGLPGMVMTNLHRSERDIVRAVLNKLGGFYMENQVSPYTTHVICNDERRRTLNVLNAIARGCWVVSLEWVICSLEANQWLPEAQFEVTTLFPAVQVSRRDMSKCNELFASLGPIFVGLDTTVPRQELNKLIRLCGGKVASGLLRAEICVGTKRSVMEELKCVKESWILDSVEKAKLQSVEKYLMPL